MSDDKPYTGDDLFLQICLGQVDGSMTDQTPKRCPDCLGRMPCRCNNEEKDNVR